MIRVVFYGFIPPAYIVTNVTILPLLPLELGRGAWMNSLVKSSTKINDVNGNDTFPTVLAVCVSKFE